MESDLARISRKEIVDAVASAIPRPPWWIPPAVSALVRFPSRRLSRLLAQFDADIGRAGVAAASRRWMDALGASVVIRGERPRGPALVVMNHPGAYDALALMSALERDDVAFLARDRPLLRAMPQLAKRMIFVNAHGLRVALKHLASGGVVVQMGAGAIEPDARFDDGDLAEWPEGTGLLASRAPAVVPAFVSGVHSPRAKKLRIVRWAEARRVTTLGPLFQATLPGFRDVDVRLTFGRAIDPTILRSARTNRERTHLVREAVRALWSRH